MTYLDALHDGAPQVNTQKTARKEHQMGRYQGPFTRRNYGRGHGYKDATGAKVPGVTTILSKGLPKPALVNWAARTAAEYAVDNWPMLNDLPVSERLDMIRRAPDATKNAAALRGTKLHDAAERLIAEGTVDVEPDQVPLVENYARFLSEWDVQAEYVESAVYNVTQGYAGTLDLIARLADGRRWLLDIKTSKGVYGDMALQLAAYRYAEFLHDDDTEGPTDLPMPQVEAVGIIHVRADGYDLVPLTAGPAEFRSFLYIAQVAATSERLRELVHAPLTPERVEVSA
jgi:hypothetical protein